MRMRLNWCAMAHIFEGGLGFRACCGPKIDQSMLERLGIIPVWQHGVNGAFWVKLVCYSPRFLCWARGSGVLWAENQLGHAREVGDHPSEAQGPGVLWAKNQSGHAREVGDLPSVVRLNFCGHLGGQMGETERTRHFRAKLVCYSPRFWRWAQGPGVLWFDNPPERAKEINDHPRNYCFVLFNPKDDDGKIKSLLQFDSCGQIGHTNAYIELLPCIVLTRLLSMLWQDVLNIYSKELPDMNYAANTGKESQFLERCLLNGKYCTLVLKTKEGVEPGEVIAAITYQIIPADTQFAEVPLAAVKSVYQHKGIGHLMYLELRKRLQHVGVRTVLCWGDKESEGFWRKQGFSVIGQVDTKGRARRLPIKADIRKALCFPGGSNLMISHFNKDNLHGSAVYLNLKFPLKPSLEDCRSPMRQEQRDTLSEGDNLSQSRNQATKTADSNYYDEMPSISRDEDYELKYRSELKGAVLRAKAYPQALLKGYDICLAAHSHPPVGTLSSIRCESAGGNVICGLDQVKDESKTIFIACEEDMDEALSAVKKGIWTFSSDWFMNCVMKQELDLGAPQFAESL
ncbi:hypothetical protein BC332_12405 [Capsicum chinense]|nr:hypothetical protein BC332_12405 [Capsicum chinense]